jgi:phage terminase Nu1 subunit (DNA packaging protein)
VSCDLKARHLATALGVSPRQVYRLERRGHIASVDRGIARVYRLDDAQRLVRQRAAAAKRDRRVAAPRSDALRLLEDWTGPESYVARAEYGELTPAQAFWAFVGHGPNVGRPMTRSEWERVGDLVLAAAYRAPG